MTTTWLPYVPYHVAEDILRHPDQDPVGREKRFEAVALFADVSGFTKISEALGKAGRAGTEELTTILNSYFDPMIDLIQSYGGIIGKFGGDAMTVLFPYTPEERAAVVRRAIQCALDMQANMHRYEAILTSAGTFKLAMKAGLAMGPVFCATAGDLAVRLEYLIAGYVLDCCADAEHHASQGEVVVHNAMLADAGPLIIVEQRDGFSCVGALADAAAPAPLVRLDQAASETSAWALQCYLPPAIAQLITAGQTGFINEHRKVTVLFVSFGGFDYDHDPGVGARLQTYLLQVIRIVQYYDGYLNKVDMGDKGSKYIVLFGAPVAHENDEERATRCALDLLAIPDTPTRIGINTGFVFCGQVGSDARREYTVMGDGVNLAARLMQAAAPSQILISGTVRRKLPNTFNCENLQPLRVKGKSQPIEVCAVQGVQGQVRASLNESGYALPMIGRQAQLQQVREWLQRARDGRGQVAGISAEAGMGKSRLMAEIAKEAAAQGCVYYTGECESYGTNISYLVWHAIWQDFFGIDPESSPDTQRARLETELAAIDPALARRMPLLGPVLNLPIPDNDLTQSLDAQLRVELQQSMLLACARARAAVIPQLFFLEDCHWIDPLSAQLLEFIGRNVSDLPIMLVLLYRPPDEEHNPVAALARFSYFHEIRLGEFSTEEAHRLIELKLAQLFGTDRAAPPELVDRLATKAQGNPFYIEEMVNLIHDRGIDPQDQRAWQAVELPDSLHSLIMSRIDQLRENEKITLKVASVIGRTFKARWLWGAYPPVGTPEETRLYLDRLSRLDLTPLDKLEPELEYLFKHITTQEVAYESLAFSMRAILHENVGDYIEQTYRGTLDRYLDVLALHYGRSRNADKQRIYFVRAGDAARVTYANEAALDYYQRALPLLPAAEQSDLKRKLGEIWQLIGQWDDAETSYRDGLALAESVGAEALQAQCQSALGWLLWHKKSYDEALRWLRRAEETFQRLGDGQGVAQAIGRAGYVFWEQGDYATALDHFERQLQIASESGHQASIAEAVGNIGIIHMDQGDYTRALACYERQRQIAHSIGHRQSELYAIGNMGSVYLDRGDAARALEYLAEALQIANEIGYLRATAMITSNGSSVYALQGDFERALACCEQALAIGMELGELPTIIVGLGNIATLYTDLARYAEAGPLFAQTNALARAVNLPYLLCDFLHNEGRLYARQQQWASVVERQTEALETAVQLGRKDIELKAQLAILHAKVQLGQLDRSDAAQQLETMLADWPGDGEQAALYDTIWQVDDARADARQTASALYRALHNQTPNVEYRQRYYALTGEHLPAPPPLALLSDDIAQPSDRLSILIAQVGALNIQITDL
jgi:class 3 adenylate cyclase/tetratricopeptide (TPR) repeat protein